MKKQQGRGQLTGRVKFAARRLLGYEITTRELRLMAHIQYVLCNEQRINPQKINKEEQEILANWVKIGYIVDGATPSGRPKINAGERLKVTKEFWTFLNEILWLAYVDLGEYEAADYEGYLPGERVRVVRRLHGHRFTLGAEIKILETQITEGCLNSYKAEAINPKDVPDPHGKIWHVADDEIEPLTKDSEE